GGHGASVRRVAQASDEPKLEDEARLSSGTRCLHDAARKNGSAQRQRRRLPRSQRNRHQEPRWQRRRRIRGRGGGRLRDGSARPDGSDSGNARSLRARNERRQGTGRGRLVTVTRSVVLGCGSYLPQRVLTNDELARKVDTSDEWIVQRTGIRERHIAAPGE